jgi:hypothetical protein
MSLGASAEFRTGRAKLFRVEREGLALKSQTEKLAVCADVDTSVTS